MMTFSNGAEADVVVVQEPEKIPAEAAETEKVVSLAEAAKIKGPVPASPATRRLAMTRVA